jgi:dCMP deaminase
MESAYIFSQRSTCNRAKVGCVITNQDKRNIVAIGYNGGAIGGENHCESIFPGMCGCIHAEPNALTKGNGTIAYSTTFPCPPCAKMLINSGIREVFYGKEYRNPVQSKLLFKRAGIPYKKIDREKYKWKLNE